MGALVNNLRQYINKLPKKKLYAYLFAFVTIVGGSVVGLSFVNNENYQPLFAGLSTEDASMVVAKLKEQKIPYQLGGNGTIIYVPKEKVYDVRLALASHNSLPGGGGTGFELFDKTSYGMTEFMQNINYKRALQGELSKTINQMPGVKSSRVHIAIPDRTLFSDKEKEVTASIFLKLSSSKALSKEEVLGLTHLVAGSVEGLKPDNITIVDSRGKVLYKGEQGDASVVLSSQHYEIQKNVEKKIEDSVQAMLDRFIPSNKSIVKVSVDLNLRKVEKVEEEYHPDKRVQNSEKRILEKSVNSSGKPGGVPGVASAVSERNAQQQVAGNQGKNSESSREESQSTFDTSKTVSKIVEPFGDIKKISLAVLLDGKYETKGEGKKQEIRYIPRSQKELTEIKNLISGAIGFDQERGDKIEVVNIAFETDTFREDIVAADNQGWRDTITQSMKYFFTALIVFAVIFFVIKPALNILKISRRDSRETIKLNQINDTLEIKGAAANYAKNLSGDSIQPVIKALNPFSDLLQNKALATSILKEWARRES